MLKNVDWLCEPAWHLQPLLGWQRPVLQSCGCTSEQDTFHDKVMQSDPEILPQCDDCHVTIAPWAPKNALLWPKSSRDVSPLDTHNYPPACLKPNIFSERLQKIFKNNRANTTGSKSWGELYLQLFQNDSSQQYTAPRSQHRGHIFDTTDNIFADIITLEPISVPKTFACGHTYDRATFEKLQACVCPLCRHVAQPWIFDNHAVTALCNENDMLPLSQNTPSNPLPTKLIDFEALQNRSNRYFKLSSISAARKVALTFKYNNIPSQLQCLNTVLNHQPLLHEARLQRALLHQKDGNHFDALMDLHSYVLANPADQACWKQTVSLAKILQRPDFIARLGQVANKQHSIAFWQIRDILQAAIDMQNHMFRIDEKFRAQHTALTLALASRETLFSMPLQALLAWHMPVNAWRSMAPSYPVRQKFFEQLILLHDHAYAARLFEATPVDCAALRSILTIHNGLAQFTFEPQQKQTIDHTTLWTIHAMCAKLEDIAEQLCLSGDTFCLFLKIVAQAYIISFEHTSRSEYLDSIEIQKALGSFLSVQLEKTNVLKSTKPIAHYILKHLGNRCHKTIRMVANNTLSNQSLKTHSTTKSQSIAATCPPRVANPQSRQGRLSWVNSVTSRFSSRPEPKVAAQDYLLDTKFRSIFV